MDERYMLFPPPSRWGFKTNFSGVDSARFLAFTPSVEVSKG